MEEVVIQRVYSILLSCCKKYDLKGLHECMYKQVRDVVKKGMEIVRNHSSSSQKDANKNKIMKLVTDSLLKCAISAYEIHHSESRIEETIECIRQHMDGLVSMSVDAMMMLIHTNQYVENMLM